MSIFTAAAVYFALNIFLNLALSGRVVRLRLATRTSAGAGGDPALEWAIRAHGNNSEYAPFALPALIFLALLDAPALVIHAVGLSYTAGRCCSAWALGWNRGRGRARQAGMALTYLALLVAAVAVMVLAFET